MRMCRTIAPSIGATRTTQLTPIWVAAAGVAILLTATPAKAAPLLSMSYDVIGGNFSAGPDDGKAVGAITGGTFVINFPAATASAPFACSFCATAVITAFNASNTVHFSWSWTGLIVNATKGFAAANAYPNAYVSTPTFVSAGVGPSLVTYVYSMVQIPNGNDLTELLNLRGLGGTQAPYAHVYHGFVVGNEVRTFVPEPSTAPLAGLGLLGLSYFAARRRCRVTRQ